MSNAAKTLNALGLSFSVAGSLLLLISPLDLIMISRDKATRQRQASTLFGNKVSVPGWRYWLWKLGPFLLFIGFALQLWANYL